MAQRAKTETVSFRDQDGTVLTAVLDLFFSLDSPRETGREPSYPAHTAILQVGMSAEKRPKGAICCPSAIESTG